MLLPQPFFEVLCKVFLKEEAENPKRVGATKIFTNEKFYKLFKNAIIRSRLYGGKNECGTNQLV